MFHDFLSISERTGFGKWPYYPTESSVANYHIMCQVDQFKTVINKCRFPKSFKYKIHRTLQLKIPLL